MASPIVISLTEKRDQLVAEVRRTESALQRLLGEIEHMDYAIEQFDPAYRRVPPAVNYTPPGAITRTLLSIMRQAKEPMTLRDLTGQMMDRLGLEKVERYKFLRTMEHVRTALIRQVKFGVVAKEVGAARGNPTLWRIVP